MKIHELQEGVEYWMTYKGEGQLHKYRINKGLIEKYSEYYDWKKVGFAYNVVVEADFEPCEWEPKVGEVYYYPYFGRQLVVAGCWDGFISEIAIKRNVGVYRTKEEAISKAKELGWT